MNADEPITGAKVSQLLEEYETEAATRSLTGRWRWVVGALAVGLSVYALYWTQYTITTQVYRAAFLLVALVLSLLLYPMRKADRQRVRWYDLALIALAVLSLGFLIMNYEQALQRITRPTVTEVAMGLLLIVLVLEATRRTTGLVLPITTLLFLLYALLGRYIPGVLGHRGYGIQRIVGQNYLTLEGMFGPALDVAATYIVLFTIYGALLEYSGAGKFFLDWSFAALGRSRSGAGPGRTVTAAGFLLGTVSGSGVATTVTLGSLAWPMLKRAGYERNTAGGILAAAGIGALLSPPTLGAAAFLIAEYLRISYLQVLVMATLPTLLYYLSCLLMIEADSRRMQTQAVELHTPPLWELTRTYGYHFTSLFAVAALMVVGMTPFMAVFWSIIIAFGLSFLRPETRLTSLRALLVGVLLAYPAALLAAWLQKLPQVLRLCAAGAPQCGLPAPEWFQRAPVLCFWVMMVAAGVAIWGRWHAEDADGADGRGSETVVSDPRPSAPSASSASPAPILLALESGGKGVLSVAATTATAGIIVSIVTLTGLGLKISGIIVALSGGMLFLTVLYAALAVWVLGLAVPVTASYIIAAVMIVPALAKVGVPEAAAHMFIFYYAVLADVSPPTALSPFAAAAITGGNPFRTMMLTWKYCLPAFLVPFMFTLSPEGLGLLLMGEPLGIAWTFTTACVAVAALAVACSGWLVRQANLLERTLAALGGLALLYANLRSDAVGLLLLLLAVALHLLRLRRAAAAANGFLRL